MILAAVPLFAQQPSACDRSVHYILQGNYAAALRQLEGAQTSGSAPGEVENLRGLALMLEGKSEEALRSFDRALELQPSLQAARFNRALTWLRMEKNDKASADLEKVWADEGSGLRAEAAYHNGIALDRMGRSEAAESWLDRALALDPTLDAALLYVGDLRERRGDIQGAGRAYYTYLEAHPDSVAAMLRFGLSAQKAGRIDVARTYLRRVIATAPRSREAVLAQKHLVMWD